MSENDDTTTNPFDDPPLERASQWGSGASPTIARLVRECWTRFRKTISMIKTHESMQAGTSNYDLIEDSFGRFRIWTGTTGAHREGLRSLDHRLRDRSHIRLPAVDLLEDLSQSLSDGKFVRPKCFHYETTDTLLVSAILDGSKIPWDKLSDTGTPEDDSDTSSQQVTELEQILESIGEIVTGRFQLSVAIGKPTTHNHHLDSLSLITLEKKQLDEDVAIDKVPSAEPTIPQQSSKLR